MKNTDRFSSVLTSANANNIMLLLDFNQILIDYDQFKIDNIIEHAILLEDFHVNVGLFSLLQAGWENTNALATKAAENAAYAKILTQGQKIYLEILTAKGNGPWEVQGEEVLQNKNGIELPWTLMPRFSTNETALLGEDLKIGVRVANKAQGVGGLRATDYLRIFGSWRKVTTITPKKKDGDDEILTSRVAAPIVTSTPTEIAPNRIDGSRRGFVAFNDSSIAILISYSAKISQREYTAKIQPGGYFEDSALKPATWQGAYWALSATGSEAALSVTELLAS